MIDRLECLVFRVGSRHLSGRLDEHDCHGAVARRDLYIEDAASVAIVDEIRVGFLVHWDNGLG